MWRSVIAIQVKHTIKSNLKKKTGTNVLPTSDLSISENYESWSIMRNVTRRTVMFSARRESGSVVSSVEKHNTKYKKVFE